MWDKRALIRFLTYASIGLSTFLFDLLLLYVLTDVFGVQYLFAAGVAFLIAVSANYLISRIYVFKGTERALGSGYINFLLIAGTGLAFVVGSMHVLVEVLGVHYLFARVSVAGITGLFNYLMNLYVNFKVAGKY